MASSPAVNGDSKTATSRIASPTHQQGKASFAGRMADGPRNGDDDGSQRRAGLQPKAWGSGVNPITQRSITPAQANGSATKPNSRGVVPQAAAAGPEKMVNDRHMHILLNAMGLQCTLVTKTGETFSAIPTAFKTKQSDSYIFCNMVQAEVKSDPAESNTLSSSSSAYVGRGPQHSMVFAMSQLALIEVPEAPSSSSRAAPASGTARSFQTDTEISGNLGLRERELQRWEAPSDGNPMNTLSGSIGQFDQFKVNKEKFGVKSEWDMKHYTTEIDKKNPLYALREKEASRIAAEIMSDAKSNTFREERGVLDEGYNEEEMYSGVRRDFAPLPKGQPNRYMPPNRRPQPAPPGNGSVDPAIISSQISRKETSVLPPEIESREASVDQPPPAAQEPKATKLAMKTGGTATETVESDVLDSFRLFAYQEKNRIHEHRRIRASQDKAVKVNDLKKFAKNFKLLTPVPKDLIPILAKDEAKQKEIVQKAQTIADLNASKSPGPTDQSTQKGLARYEPEATSPSARRQPDAGLQPAQYQKGHPGVRENAQGVPSGLSQRLADTRRLHKQGMPVSIPNPLATQNGRAPPAGSSQYSSALPSPQKQVNMRGMPSATSTKFNVQALEFKPNPTAITFKPASMVATPVTSSPGTRPITRSISPNVPQPKLYKDMRSFRQQVASGNAERPTPLTVAKGSQAAAPEAVAQAGSLSPEGSSNSTTTTLEADGEQVQQPYRNQPTWNHSDDPEKYTKYMSDFSKARSPSHAAPSSRASPMNPVTHQPQLAVQLQASGQPVPHLQPPQQVPHHLHGQQPHFPQGLHFEDPRMRQASMSATYAGPSPRMQNVNMVYASPLPPHAQIPYGQPMGYVMHGGQPMAPRQFSNGPHAPPGQHLVPMVPQNSGAGYIQAPVLMPFSPQTSYIGPVTMYGTPQPPSGYPSPGRGASMMMHSGSHQGHNAQVYMPAGQFGQPVYGHQTPGQMRPGFSPQQPPFPQGPYQQHHYAHRTPSSGYVQPHPVHHAQMMAAQAPSGPHQAGPMDAGDEAK